MEQEVMKSLQERILIQAEGEGRFSPQTMEFHCIQVADVRLLESDACVELTNASVVRQGSLYQNHGQN